MLLSAHEIAQGRERTLRNLLTLSAAGVRAAQQWTRLLATAGRDSFRHGVPPVPQSGFDLAVMQWPVSWWLDHLARTSQLLDQGWSVCSDTQKAVILSADQQLQIIDSLAISTINRARRSSPWEADIALQAMQSSLQAAEQTVHEISQAALDTLHS
ncbi:MAG: hypothetical protein ACK4FE_02780 [Azonexus sp.]